MNRGIVHYGASITDCGKDVTGSGWPASHRYTYDRSIVTCGECLEARAHLDAKAAVYRLPVGQRFSVFEVGDRVGFNFSNGEAEGWVRAVCRDGYLVSVDGYGDEWFGATPDEMWHLPDQKCALCGKMGPIADSLRMMCEPCAKGGGAT